MKTLIIYVDSMSDTKFLSKVYKNLASYTLLYNPSKSEVTKHLVNEYKTIIILGHGDYNGLYNRQHNGYIIDSSMVPQLINKTIIGCWCYASEFALRYDLHGFFTSMFISNSKELIECGFTTFLDCDKIIESENNKFAELLNDLILSGCDMNKYVSYLQSNCSEYNFSKYNYEALYYH